MSDPYNYIGNGDVVSDKEAIHALKVVMGVMRHHMIKQTIKIILECDMYNNNGIDYYIVTEEDLEKIRKL